MKPSGSIQLLILNSQAKADGKKMGLAQCAVRDEVFNTCYFEASSTIAPMLENGTVGIAQFNISTTDTGRPVLSIYQFVPTGIAALAKEEAAVAATSSEPVQTVEAAVVTEEALDEIPF